MDRMNMFENLKKGFFKRDSQNSKLSIPMDSPNIDKTLSNTEIDYDRFALGYFEDDSAGYFSRKDNSTLITKQNDLIKKYRKVAIMPEISAAIEEIVNEMSFVVDNETILSLDISKRLEANDKLKEAFINNFNEILNLMNFNYNADSILKQFYIDGQIRFGCSYSQKSGGMRSGISAIHILSPLNLFYHQKEERWKYFTQNNNTIGITLPSNNLSNVSDKLDLSLTDEELVTIDSGLYAEGMVLSHLHTVLKISNQLSSLEDMLIPLRFSRSVSRRVFNIDVGDLPYAKAMQAVKDIQDKFKYKKYYDIENGTITNNTSVASIVEDYYFPSRGGKGTSVDVLDESGNLGEIGDIEYFQKKLYGALKVPLGRLTGSDKSNVYDYSGTQIEQDEIRFFAFINRIRQRFNQGLLEILKRHMVAKGLVTVSEFEHYQQFLIVSWERESNFLERQKIELMKAKLDLYSQVKEFIGEVYSKSWVLKNVLKMTEDEVVQMHKEMEIESLGQLVLTQPNLGTDVTDTTGIGDETDDADNTKTNPEGGLDDTSDTNDNVASPEFGGTMSAPNK